MVTGIWGKQPATVEDGSNEQQQATGPPKWTAQTMAATRGHDPQRAGERGPRWTTHNNQVEVVR